VFMLVPEEMHEKSGFIFRFLYYHHHKDEAEHITFLLVSDQKNMYLTYTYTIKGPHYTQYHKNISSKF
jgi:dTDP-4-dehydrorhamnose 3,5-epimerase-like enzyme